MSLFDAPEYRSYIALCRELRLEREIVGGDYVAWPTEEGRSPLVLWTGASPGPGLWVWLPRLDQWLAMLEETALDVVVLVRDARWGRSAQTGGHQPAVWAPTYEEAAARLWLAVTRHEVRA